MNRVRVTVRRTLGGALRTGVVVDGVAAQERWQDDRTAPLPNLVSEAWSRATGHAESVRHIAVQVGRLLRDALFAPSVAQKITLLIDGSARDTVTEIVFDVDNETMLLPYEMLVLIDDTPLVTRPNIALLRHHTGAGQVAGPPLPGPLKILAAVAAPTETRTTSRPLDVEAEMQAILGAVADVATAGGGAVRILEVASLEQITAALRADEFHVLHLGTHGSATILELEDEDGDPVIVEAAQLAAALRASGRALPLVVLSSCGGVDGGTGGLAHTLIRGGVERVLVMQTSISDRYATLLSKAFYDMLAADPGTTAALALGRARHMLEQQPHGASTEGEQPPEWFVPTLLTTTPDRPLWDSAAPPRPLARRTLAPSGATVRELPIGYLIGRREPVRGVLRLLTAPTQPGVTIAGMGGLGKTAVAGRVLARMRERGWRIVEHVGQWNPPALFAALREAIGDEPALRQAAQALAESNDNRRMAALHRVLAEGRVLLLFDDFEQNLLPGGADFLDPGFRQQFSRLCRVARTGRVLVTCRYPIPGNHGLAEVALRPLSTTELQRMFLRLPQLTELTPEDRALVTRTIGGHPRLIEFIDALLRGGDGFLQPVGAKLRALATEHGVDLEHDRTLAESLDTAVVLGTRDILIDALLALLNPGERELLLQVALSRTPLGIPDIAYARFGADATGSQLKSATAGIRRLAGLTLVGPADEDRYLIHPWVAQALDVHQGADRVRRHNRAYAMRRSRMAAGYRDFDDCTEACRHLLGAGRYAELTELALPLCQELSQLDVAALLGEIMPTLPVDTPGYPALVDREVLALRRTGNLGAATDRQQTLVDVLRARVQDAAGSAQARRDLGLGLYTLGDLAMLAGNLGAAREHYARSLLTARHLTRVDPGNIDMQQALARALESLGEIALRAGDLAAALEQHTEALALRRRLAAGDGGRTCGAGDGGRVPAAGEGGRMLGAGEAGRMLGAGDPGRAELDRALGAALNRLGDTKMLAAELESARRDYTESLTIHRAVVAGSPDDVTSRRGLAITLGKLGDLAVRVGDAAGANRHYTEKLRITADLSDADPGDTEARRDVAIALQQIGDVALLLDLMDDAHTFFTDSLAIHRELATKDPGNAEYRRDVGVALNRTGDLALRLGNTTGARDHYTEALAIHRALADTDSTNARNQRDLSVSHDHLGELALRTGDYVTADHHYTQSLILAEQLAAADPSNADKQRDIVISHHRLAKVATALGAYALAFRHNTEALNRVRRLTGTDPTNGQLRRDTVLILLAIGETAEYEHDLDTAVEVYNDALAIANDLLRANRGSARARSDVEYTVQNLERVLTALGRPPIDRLRMGEAIEQGKALLSRFLQ